MTTTGTTDTKAAPRGGVRLYELGQARDILDTWLAETEGEETPEIKALWEQLQGDTEAKIGGWARYTRELEAEAKAAKEEAQHVARRAAALANAAQRSKDGLARQMVALGIEKAKAAYFHPNNPSLEVAGGELTQDRLQELFLYEAPFVKLTPETFTLDRAAALDYAKTHGDDHLPAELRVVRDRKHLRLR